MAVNTGKQGGNQSSEQRASQYQHETNHGFAETESGVNPNQYFDLGHINQSIGRSSRIGGSSGRPSHVEKAIRRFVNPEGVRDKRVSEHLDVQTLSKEQAEVPMPAVLLIGCYRDKNTGQQYSVVRTILVEPTEKHDQAPIAQLFSGQNRVDYQLRASDIACEKYWKNMVKALSTISGEQNMIYLSAGPIFLPKDFDLEDDNLVLNLIQDSETRIEDELGRHTNEPAFTLANMDNQNKEIIASLTFNEPTITTLNALPVRSDIQVTLRQAPRVQGNNGNNPIDGFGGEVVEVSNISGFLNFYPHRATVLDRNTGFKREDVKYSPVYVITHTTQGRVLDANTLGTWLMAMGTGFYVTAGGSFIQDLLPTNYSKDMDPKETGALGLICGCGVINTKTDQLTDEQHLEFFRHIFDVDETTGQPSLGFAIDVNAVGENSVIDETLRAAAHNGGNNNAQHAIYEAAVALTCGYIRGRFDASKWIVQPTGQFISLGYYTDNDGVKRDLRTIDTRWMANALAPNNDAEKFKEWLYTFEPNSTGSPLFQMKQREKFESNWISNAVYTGWAERLVVNAEFLAALYDALRDAGLTPRVENARPFRSGPAFAANGVFSGATTNYQAGVGYANATGSQNWHNGGFGMGNF